MLPTVVGGWVLCRCVPDALAAVPQQARFLAKLDRSKAIDTSNHPVTSRSFRMLHYSTCLEGKLPVLCVTLTISGLVYILLVNKKHLDSLCRVGMTVFAVTN